MAKDGPAEVFTGEEVLLHSKGNDLHCEAFILLEGASCRCAVEEAAPQVQGISKTEHGPSAACLLRHALLQPHHCRAIRQAVSAHGWDEYLC